MKVLFIGILIAVLGSTSLVQADVITCSKQYRGATYQAIVEISSIDTSISVSKGGVSIAEQKFKTAASKELHDLNVTVIASPILTSPDKPQLSYAEINQGGPVLSLLLRGSALPKKMKFDECDFSL